jgi:hypothetical protein
MYLPQATERIRARWGLAKHDPIAFLRWFVYSCDQHDKIQPCKAFPWHLDYVQYIVRLWQANPKISILKSRQMMLTWLFVILAVWEGMFHPGRLIMLQSKREADAVGDENNGDGLLGRAKYVMNHMPCREMLCPEYEPMGKKILYTTQGSTLQAIPQGGDVIRTHTVSMVVSDEAAMQEECSDAHAAAMPCIRGGGSYVSITTPRYGDKGFTRSLHEDTLSETG